MPDNDLDRRLAVVEQTFGLRPNDNAVTTPNLMMLEQLMLTTSIGKLCTKFQKVKSKQLFLILTVLNTLKIGELVSCNDWHNT